MAAKLLQTPRSIDIVDNRWKFTDPQEIKKIIFPEITSDKELYDFVGPESWYLFDKINLGTEWMNTNPPWDHIDSYGQIKHIITSIVPINDSAERMCATAKRYRVMLTLSLYLQ